VPPAQGPVAGAGFEPAGRRVLPQVWIPRSGSAEGAVLPRRGVPRRADHGTPDGGRGVKRVVISQPFFFPWVGMFEQVRLADVYVHYDDVQFSKGHFANRVQYKTAAGSAWLTVPLKDLHLGQLIKDVQFDDKKDWRARHLAQLAQAYDKAPYRDEMLALVREVYARPARGVCDVSVESIHAVCHYFGFADPEQFLFSSQMGVPGSSTQRVLETVEKVGGDVYITGHG